MAFFVDPRQDLIAQGFTASGADQGRLVVDPLAGLIFSNIPAGGSLLYTRSQPELAAGQTVSAPIQIEGPIGADTGTVLRFNRGAGSYQATLTLKQGGSGPVVAVFAGGAGAYQDVVAVNFANRETWTVELTDAGITVTNAAGTSGQVSAVAMEPGSGAPSFQFGVDNPGQPVTIKVAKLGEDATIPSTKVLEIVSEKLELKNQGVTDDEHDHHPHDDDVDEEKAGVKFEGTVRPAGGDTLDPLTMPVSLRLTGPGGEFYPTGGVTMPVSGSFVLDGSEYKYKVGDLKVGLEDKGSGSWELELKHKHLTLPDGTYSPVTVAIAIGDYAGSVELTLVHTGHKWKYEL